MSFYQSLFQFLIAAFLLYFPFIWCSYRKESTEIYGLTWKFSRQSFIEGTLVTGAVLIPLTFIAIHWPTESLPRYSSFSRTINLAGAGVAAAVIEEVFFRGWLQTLLRKRLSPSPAIILSSMLFASAHLFMNPVIHSIAVFFPGTVMGGLRERHGTIASSTLFHAIANIWAIWFSPSIWFIDL